MGELTQIITCLAAIIVPMMCGFTWVVTRIDKLDNKFIHYVSQLICRLRRDSCPCMSLMKASGVIRDGGATQIINAIK